MGRRGIGVVMIGSAMLLAHAVGALEISVYATVDSARAWLDPAAREAAVSRFRTLGVGRVILEVNRGGTALTEDEGRQLRGYFESRGLAVMGGIATVPGGDWGVPANEGLAWMNFQHPETQADIEASIRAAARVFDVFVVDDFLLTGDTSPLSVDTKGNRTWGQYRRDLMTALSQRSIIAPAKEENPGIHMIVKFPQSYDRYQFFGYDTNRMPQLYDGVWVGTETRGQYTQRFGFTQPYEAFVNYRWIASLSGGKMGAAWFDFGDCDAVDFAEQPWQAVLAGARELVLFSYGAVEAEHPGLALFKQDRPGLEQLAEAVAEQPVTGVAAYKLPNSDPASDMYIMDFIGMLGVPLVPVSTWPADATALFVPAQGAHDAEVVARIEASVQRGANVMATTGLLATATGGERLATLAGLNSLPAITPMRTPQVLVDGATVEVPRGVDLAGRLDVGAAEVLLTALVDGEPVPFLTTRRIGSGRISVLNLHMFTQADFEAVNEVLLSPRNPGLLDMPVVWANTLRAYLGGGGEVLADAPPRVTFQPLGDSGWFIQNFNTVDAAVTVRTPGMDLGRLTDAFSDVVLLESGEEWKYVLPPRSRVWVRR